MYHKRSEVRGVKGLPRPERCALRLQWQLRCGRIVRVHRPLTLAACERNVQFGNAVRVSTFSRCIGNNPLHDQQGDPKGGSPKTDHPQSGTTPPRPHPPRPTAPHANPPHTTPPPPPR